MFEGAESFNGDIGSWSVSDAFSMSSMFLGATAFNVSIAEWDVSSVTDMSFMLADASSFNHDLCSFGERQNHHPDLSVEGMFAGSGCPMQADPVLDATASDYGSPFCHGCIFTILPVSCSAYAGCQGLQGNCCPDDAGTYLACCNESS